MDMPRISKKESVKPIEEDSGGTSRTSDGDIILCNNTHDEGTNNSCHILGHVSLHTKLQKKINELSREMDKDPTLCSILDPSRNISQISNQNNNYADKKAVNSMTNRGRRMEDTKIEDSSHDDDDGCMSDGISVDQIPSDEELPLETSTPASDDGSMTDYHVMDRSTGQKCEFCGVEKRTPAELRRHLMKHTGERPFVCLLCDYARAFKAKRSLQYHQFSVHGIEHKNISERYPDIRKRKLEAGELIDESVITELHKQSKFEEEECGNSSDGEGCNTGHVVNGYEPIKKRVCQICSKVCVKPSDLKRHMMSHTGERPFKCEVCGKPFRAKNSMMYHLKSSHGYDVELSPGLEERFLKLKKQAKVTQSQVKVTPQSGQKECASIVKHELGFPSYLPCGPYVSYMGMEVSVETKHSEEVALVESLPSGNLTSTNSNLPESVKTSNVFYSYDSHSFPMSKASLDEASGLFKYEEKETPDNESLSPLKCDNIPASLAKPGESLVGKVLTEEGMNGSRSIHILSETVLVSRLDGVLPSGQNVSLYRCYLCSKVYNYLSHLRYHLMFHFNHHITTYLCKLCNTSFWFRLQIIQHLRKKHSKIVRHISQKSQSTTSKHTHMPETSQSDSGIFMNDNQSDSSSDTCTDQSIQRGLDRNGNQSLSAYHSITDMFYELSYERNKNGTFVCMICKRRFTAETKLLRHIKVHNNQHTFYCSICNHGYANAKGLHNHMTKQHKIPVNQTSQCKSSVSPVEAKSDPGTVSKSTSDKRSPIIKTPTMKEEEAQNHLLIHLLKKSGNTIQHEDSAKRCNSHENTQKKDNILQAKGHQQETMALLEKEGLSDDVTIVMPCDPEEQMEAENLSMSHKNDSSLDLSTKDSSSETKKSVPQHIQSVPKRTLMDNRTIKSKRKSSQPTRICHTNKALYSKPLNSYVEHGETVGKDDIQPLSPEYSRPVQHTAAVSTNVSSVTVPTPISSANTVGSPLPTYRPNGEQKEATVLPSHASTADFMSSFLQHSAQAQAQLIASNHFVQTLVSLGGKAPNLSPLAQALANPTAQALISAGQYSTVIHALANSGHLPSTLAQSLLIQGTEKSLPESSSATVVSPASPYSRTLAIPPTLSESLAVQAAAALQQKTHSPNTDKSTEPGRPDITAPHPAFSKAPIPYIPGYNFPNLGLPVSIVTSTESSDLSPRPESAATSDASLTEDHGKNDEGESKDQLHGYPKVQWSPKSEAFQWHHITPDGRKVTSLSRTHSRLPIVNAPVDRDLICKPMQLDDGRQVFRCPFCSKDFLSYSDINRHMDFHEDIRPYKCKYCEYYARTNSQLKVHMMRHQGIREFCCRVCNYKGVTQSDLNRHMKSQIHMLKSRNECHYCGEGFVTGKNLEKHLDGNCIIKVQQERGDLLM